MSMFVEKEKNRIKVLIPNSEATISAQLKSIKDSEVTGFYTSDKEDYKKQIDSFLSKDYEYILDIKAILNVINTLKDDFFNDYKELYKDCFSNINKSLEFFCDKNYEYLRIPNMYYGGQNARYLKFENTDPIIKNLRAILYGDITGFYIISKNNYYVISPFILEDAREILEKRKGKILKINQKRVINMREQFKRWLIDKDLSEKTIQNYVSYNDITSKQAIEDNLINKNIYEINNSKELIELINKLKENDKYNFRRIKYNNINTAAINHYLQFLQSIEDNNPKNEYSKSKFLKEAFMEENKYDSIVSILKRKKNIILEGAPGVGKTFMAKRLAYSIIGKKDTDKVKLIQFHQSYAYEDFIEGYKPTKDGFELQTGIFYELCEQAKKDSNNNYYIIIDEINRGNLSKIFGELLMLIESDKRGDSLTLAYSKREFSVPKNLYIIGLMNTADRSLALIDYALRRRFAFIRIEPAFENEKFIKDFNEKFENNFSGIIEIIKKINVAIEQDKSLGAGFKIGHSYFCQNLEDRKGTKKDIEDIINYEILPLLEEYWYDDPDSIVQWKDSLYGVLND